MNEWIQDFRLNDSTRIRPLCEWLLSLCAKRADGDQQDACAPHYCYCFRILHVSSLTYCTWNEAPGRPLGMNGIWLPGCVINDCRDEPLGLAKTILFKQLLRERG